MLTTTKIKNTISQATILQWLKNTADRIQANKLYLIELDSPIGDADHGINMERGFKKVMSKIAEFATQDIGMMLKNTGMALISSVGGAAGPLYGTFYLKAGMALTNKTELNLEDFTIAFEKGLTGVKARGRAVVGEKTMVDVLEPVLNSLKLSIREEDELKIAFKKAVKVAEESMKATIPMLAKKGRASYLGERSIGHQDPGATSSYLILSALYDSIKTQS